MTCREIQLQIPALLLDDLPVAEREAVRTHCRECAGCREEWQRLGGALDRFAALPDRPAEARRREAVVAAMVAAGGPQAPPARRTPTEAPLPGGTSAGRQNALAAPPRRRVGVLWLLAPLAAAAAIVIAVIGKGPTPATPRAPFAFRVTDRIGVVEIQRPGQNMWEQARKNDPIGPGDRLRTARNGFATIEDPVQGRLSLNGDTCIALLPTAPGSPNDTIALERGECWSEPNRRETGHLFIESPDGSRVEVVGTKFNVRYR